MLSIQDVSVGYPNHKDILQNIYLDVHPGEILTLIGKNGAGKTTLIRGLTGLLPLRTGNIFFNNQNLGTMVPRDRAKLISVVPQAASLPAGYTVFETVSHGRTPYLNWFGKLGTEDRRIIEHSINITGLMPFLDKEVSTLSGGEQQRVILARALAQNAPVMILDEPTNSLDFHYQVSLLDLERKICKENNLAVIIILHDINLAARYSDRIAILENGRIIENDRPEKVLREDNLSSVFSTPIRVVNDPDDGLIIIPKKRQ